MPEAIMSPRRHGDQPNVGSNLNRRKILALFVLLSIVLTLVAWWGTRTHQKIFSFASFNAEAIPEPLDLSLNDLKVLDVETVTAMQREAAQRVGEDLNAHELIGPITSRPEFISPVEWFVVKEVAAKNANSEEALTRLVNNFRFIKHMELWQAIASGEIHYDSVYDGQGIDQRALAEHLLKSLPARIAAKDMSKSQAQQIQMALIMDIETDPLKRHQRLREEAQRIGVQFEIDQHSDKH
ncbi:MAG: hypothetical protein KBT87_06250 [Gammaproteobacteria bacterium]|nr:hypothetical protein [Gammaproteobacteria bacterium]MBQ0774256.1 hypothetical protein [Gammaproteobacteria bacterium]